MNSYKDILDFWFVELSPSDWWKKSEELDANIGERFGSLLEAAKNGELYQWRMQPSGRLAEIIVLDQFSRNIYRDTPKAFLADPLALILAQEAVGQNVDIEIDKERRSFLYMPYMHSESRIIHEEAVRLFTDLGNSYNLDFEMKHKAIVDRFGRYPHRNQILGRESTPEEVEFLKGPNSAF